MQFARAVAITKCSGSQYPPFLRVLIKTSNVVCGSNVRWRGRSFAASVPSDSSKHQRSYKRISKHERRAMVESFVNKYRASNAGRFPGVSLTKKELGGCFYVIRQILQELEYECKESTTGKMNKVLLEKTVRTINRHLVAKEEPEALIEDQEISTAGEIIDHCLDVREEPHVLTRVEHISSPVSVSSISYEQKLEGKENSGMKVAKEKTEEVIIEHLVAKQEHIQLAKEDATEFGFHTRFSNDKDPMDFRGDEDSVVSVRRASRGRKRIGISSENSGNDKDPKDFRGNEDSVVSVRRASRGRKRIGVSMENSGNSSDQHSFHDQIRSHQSNMESEAEVSFRLPEEPGGNKTDAIAAKGIRISAQAEVQSVHKDRDGLHTESRNLPKKLEHEESSTLKPTLWLNLKAIADGFINFWKKL